MKNSFVCFKLYLLKTIKLAPSWWKVPAEPLQELKLFIHSGAHLQPIGVNDKPLIERFAGSWVRPCQGRQQLCKLPSTSEGELGPSSRELAQPKIPPRNCSCRAATGMRPAALWGCFLPKKLCSGPGNNGVFAASDTSGVCSPSLPCARWGVMPAGRIWEQATSRPGMSRVHRALQDNWSLLSFGIILVSQFSSSVLGVCGVLHFYCQNQEPGLCGEMQKAEKEKKKKDRFSPLPPIKALLGRKGFVERFPVKLWQDMLC